LKDGVYVEGTWCREGTWCW